MMIENFDSSALITSIFVLTVLITLPTSVVKKIVNKITDESVSRHDKINWLTVKLFSLAAGIYLGIAYDIDMTDLVNPNHLIFGNVLTGMAMTEPLSVLIDAFKKQVPAATKEAGEAAGNILTAQQQAKKSFKEIKDGFEREGLLQELITTQVETGFQYASPNEAQLAEEINNG